MSRYFFDTRDGSDFIEDDLGLKVPNLEQVKIVAAKSLADLAPGERRGWRWRFGSASRAP